MQGERITFQKTFGAKELWFYANVRIVAVTPTHLRGYNSCAFALVLDGGR